MSRSHITYHLRGVSSRVDKAITYSDHLTAKESPALYANTVQQRVRIGRDVAPVGGLSGREGERELRELIFEIFKILDDK